MTDDRKPAIREFIGRFIEGHRFSDDEDLFAAGFVNSMFVLQLVQFVESELGGELDDDDLEFANFSTVAAIEALLHRKLAVRATGR